MSAVTILGSCSLIDFPKDVPAFFKDKNLVDVRNGYRMEMDALPLFFLAREYGDEALEQKIVDGLINNLQDSGGELWRCGVWGHNEVHLRFSSIALRVMLFFPERFDKTCIQDCLRIHLAYRDKVGEGVWFYHDSIEKDKQPYYKPWDGVDFAGADDNNMLILNTHLDTLTTLLIAENQGLAPDFSHELIDQALTTLEQYLRCGEEVRGVPAIVDGAFRRLMIRLHGNTSWFASKLSVLVIRTYYRRFRLWFKKRHPVLKFSDGYLERDLRLPGPNLDYHVVNVWDMSKLMFWLHITGRADVAIVPTLTKHVVSGLAYCHKSVAYRKFLRKIGQSKGVTNEVLEAIAILCVLEQGLSWMAELYMELRAYAPPSVGIMGFDKSLSGIGPKDDRIRASAPCEGVDKIPFANDTLFIANYSDNDYTLRDEENMVNWCSSPLSGERVPAKSIAVVRVKN